jgi:hypothetical protein
MDCDIWGYYILKVHRIIYINNLIMVSLGISNVTSFFIDLNTISQSCENLDFGHHFSQKQKKINFVT